MIHVYYGDGKGKTTAAVVAAVRAAGHSVPVIFCQFLQDGLAGEIGMLEKMPGVYVLLQEHYFPEGMKLTEEEIHIMENDCNALIRRGVRTMSMVLKAQPRKVMVAENRKQKFGVVKQPTITPDVTGMFVFDGLLDALEQNLVEREEIMHILLTLPPHIEVVITGRNPSLEFMALADYVTYMEKDRHPKDDGLMPRMGIEK